MTGRGTATGMVRLWEQDGSGGVIDSDELPGSCWADASAVEEPTGDGLRAGQVVEVTWEEPGPSGHRCRATSVRVRDDLEATPGA